MPIRPASEADLPAITAIFNDVIAHSTAIYADDPFTPEDRAAWFAARQALGYPVLVADEGGGVLGLASFGDFRAWPGYRHTVEHSVHVRADARGKGLGSALVAALFEPARALGKHVMIAGIDATNEGSIRMHERLGFARGAVLREVGRKFAAGWTWNSCRNSSMRRGHRDDRCRDPRPAVEHAPHRRGRCLRPAGPAEPWRLRLPA